jgi:SAM-dependent methyltransferase
MTNKNIIRGWLNSWFLDILEGYMDKKYGARKRFFFSGLPDRFVEIGPGAGANFRYYRPGTYVIAVEPNTMMHPRLRKNAAQYQVQLDVKEFRGEEIDLETESIDAVVGTLVLCTVEDPERVISEVHRILKPGGRYVFLEHVAGLPGTRLRMLQDLLHRPWHWLFEGCNLNRDTHAILLKAGFSVVDVNCFMLNASLVPVTPHIFGMALK